MKALRKQLRQTYPGILVALFAVLAFDYALCIVYEIRYADGGYVGEPIGNGARIVDMTRLGAYAFIAALLCMNRFRITHPCENSAYLHWLRTTPWAIDRPLPFGPVLPCWSDLLVLVIFVTFYAYGPVAHVAWIPVVFIWSYVGLTAMCLCGAGYLRTSLAIGVAAIAAGLSYAQPLLVLAITLVALGIVCVGIRHCLGRFHELPLRPWEVEKHRALIFQGPNAQPRLDIEDDIGKSHKLLHADKIEPITGYGVCVVLTLSVGSLGYVLSKAAIEEQKLKWVAGYTIFFVFFVVLIRWAAYAGKAPISLRGRWRTGRWIISAYDRMFIAPAVIGVCAIAVWFGLQAVATPIQWTTASTVAITMLLATGMGPSRGVHFLTGAQHYHLSKFATGKVASKFEQGSSDTSKTARPNSA